MPASMSRVMLNAQRLDGPSTWMGEIAAVPRANRRSARRARCRLTPGLMSVRTVQRVMDVMVAPGARHRIRLEVQAPVLELNQEGKGYSGATATRAASGSVATE